MIRDLSETLRAILKQPGLPPPLNTAQVVFDRPTAQFNPPQSAIDLFLFDIRENAELRNHEPTVIHSNGHAIIRRPPMRVDCSYLVTAWIAGGVDVALQEQLLLSQVLQVLVRYPTIPEPFLQGGLKTTSGTSVDDKVNLPENTSEDTVSSGENTATSGGIQNTASVAILPSPVLEPERLPIPLSVAVPGASRQPTEFWTSLGIPIRASLIVTATIALDLNDAIPTALPLVTSHAIGLKDMESGVSVDRNFQIGGQVRLADNQPAVAARITLLDRNQVSQTDGAGFYQFSAVPAGTHTLQVQLSDGTTRSFTVTVPPLQAQPFDLQLT